MLQVVTKDGKSTTFSSDFVWYRDKDRNIIVIYRDLSDDKHIWKYNINDISYFYAGNKEVKLNGEG